ncbi:Hsp20/alpha crystallin family protein [Salinithrix halophila]|uniref:Hsp20/alpha crystallin family protein n=1 Tax=Salinithrix halophila TaxID=1485204 RepID=A0ABV8JFK4_9BACL
MNESANFSKWSQMARDFLGEDFWSEVSGMGEGKHPKTDVLLGRNEVIVLMDLPGVDNLEDVDIRVEGETLFVKGTVPTPYTKCDRLVSECFRGAFERVIPLGRVVSRRQGSARYRRGVLEIRLPMISSTGDDRRIRVSDS